MKSLPRMTLTSLTTVLSQGSSAAYAHLGHHGSGTKDLLFAVLTDAHIHAALYTQRSRNDRGSRHGPDNSARGFGGRHLNQPAIGTHA